MNRTSQALLVSCLISAGAFAQAAPKTAAPATAPSAAAPANTPAAPATAAAPAAQPATPASFPQPPDLDSTAYILVDVNSGQTLAGKNVDAAVEPASLTKMMTAYVVFDALRAKKITLTQTLPITPEAWKTPGSRMFVQVGTQVPVEDLIKGMIVQSGNDAAMALAEGVGGTVTHFVELMNQQAQALGMKNTHFMNPDGLPAPGHETTARDLATLTQHLLTDFPEDSQYFAIKHYLYPGTPKSNGTNRNRMLFLDPTVDGMKTGHTQAAGYCLVTTAKRDFPNLDGRRLVSVILGASSDRARTADAQKLLNWGYTAWDDVKLFDAGQPAATPRVWKGKSNELKLGLPDRAIVVSVPQGKAKDIKTDLIRPDPLIAPFTKGEKVATLKVTLGDDTLAETPLVALDAVPQAGFFSRIWDSARMLIHR